MNVDEAKPEFHLIDSGIEIKQEDVWNREFDTKKEPEWNEFDEDVKWRDNEEFKTEVSHISYFNQEIVGECSESYQLWWNDNEEKPTTLESEPNWQTNEEHADRQSSPFWHETNTNSGLFSESAWNDDVEEKPPIFEPEKEFKVEEDDDSEYEPPPILEAEGCVKKTGPSASKQKICLQLKMKKPVIIKKNKVAGCWEKQNDVNNENIAKWFRRFHHPSVQLMIDLAEKNQMTFSAVFKQFEHLRAARGIKCVPNDPCNRTRNRFKTDTITPCTGNVHMRSTCLNVFPKVPWAKEIDISYIHLILDRSIFESDPTTHCTPACIRQEWETYRESVQKVFNWSDYKFAHDLTYFTENAHPRVRTMIDMAQKAEVPYERVYNRFEELRKAKGITCAKYDTCLIISKFTQCSKHQLRRYIRELLLNEFARLSYQEKDRLETLPLHIIHTLMERFRVSRASIVSFHVSWKLSLTRTKAAVLEKNSLQALVPLNQPLLFSSKTVHPYL